MSHNLIELLKQHGDGDGGTALDVLKEAVDERGEVTDDDRRRGRGATGLPEAAVYGVSTFYDDLVQPRGSGTSACAPARRAWRPPVRRARRAVERELGAQLGERSEDGAVSLAETVCLGFCHASPAFRDGDVVDAGPGALERVLAGATRAAPEPVWESLLDEPVLTAPGDWSGFEARSTERRPEAVLDAVKAANLRGRGGAGFPAGMKWEFARSAKGDARSSSSSTATRATPAPTSTSS